WKFRCACTRLARQPKQGNPNQDSYVRQRPLAEGSRVDVEMNREITESRASERVRMCQYSLAYLLHRISVFGWPLLVTMTGLQSPVVPKEGPSLNFAPKPMLSA